MKNRNRITKITRDYNRRASEYDNMSRKAYPWLYFDRPYVLKHVVPLVKPSTKLLEIGSGSGKVLELFKGRLSETNITGIDLSKELIKISKRYFPEATLKVGNFASASFPQNKFDIALSVRSIEYLNQQSLERAFKNVHKSLKKGGRFFLLTGHPLRINNANIGTYLERGTRMVSLPWGMKVDLYHKTVSDILNAAIKAGLRLEAIDEPDVPLALKKIDSVQYKKYQSHGATNLHIVFVKP